MDGESPSWEAGEALGAGALQCSESSGGIWADQGLGPVAGQGLEQDEFVRRAEETEAVLSSLPDLSFMLTKQPQLRSV